MAKTEIDELIKRITYNPGIFGGKPIIRGIRFRVTDVLDMLANDMTKQLILQEHPVLEAEDIAACLLYASMILNNLTFVNTK